MDKNLPPAPTPLATMAAVPGAYPGRHRAEAAPSVPVPLPDFRLPVGPAGATAAGPGPAEPVGDLELLIRSAYDGPARRPLLGYHRAPGRFVKTLGAITGVVLATVSLLSVGSAVVAAAPEDRDRPVVATYTRPSGEEGDLRALTCQMLANDIVESGHLVVNNPSVLTPKRVRAARPIADHLTEIADLPKGDVAREALTCRGRGQWVEGFGRDVVFTLVVAGGESSMATTSVWTHR